MRGRVHHWRSGCERLPSLIVLCASAEVGEATAEAAAAVASIWPVLCRSAVLWRPYRRYSEFSPAGTGWRAAGGSHDGENRRGREGSGERRLPCRRRQYAGMIGDERSVALGGMLNRGSCSS